MTVTVTGLSAARAALRRIPGEARRLVRQRAIVPTAQAVLATARARVPVRTGALKASLAMSVDAKTGRARVGVTGVTAAAYAAHVNYGTVHTRAQPFLTVAAHSEKDNYARRVRQAGKALEKALAVR